MAYRCVYNENLECDGCMKCKPEPKLLCECCEEPIADYYYDIGGEILCKDCMEDMYRKEIDYED